MSDSLRDQLLQAGFSQKAKEPAKNKQRSKPKKSGASRPNKAHTPSPQAPSGKTVAEAAADKRKAIKAKIKTLIETAEVKEFAGEIVYRFTLQNRIRELHVKEDVRKQLVDGALTVTRLNGTTRLVPSEIVEQIRTINPNWAIVSAAPDSPDDNAGYEEFPVPDDIVW